VLTHSYFKDQECTGAHIHRLAVFSGSTIMLSHQPAAAVGRRRRSIILSNFVVLLLVLLRTGLAVIDIEGVRVVTKEELSTKTSADDGNELWLSILGEVYNVTAGSKYYREGATYHVFVGRDGSAR